MSFNRKSRILRTALVASTLLLGTQNTLAQDKKDKSDFFDHDFVEKGMEELAQPGPEATVKVNPLPTLAESIPSSAQTNIPSQTIWPTPLASAVESPQPSLDPKPPDAAVSPEKTPSNAHDLEETLPEVAGASRMKNFEIKKTHKVKAIGFILNFEQDAHAQVELPRILAMAKKYAWPLGNFYFVASAKGLPVVQQRNIEMMQLVARGAEVGFSEKVPEKYPDVRRSPVWLVQTEDGEFVLEALERFEDYFNGAGEFLEPMRKKVDSD